MNNRFPPGGRKRLEMRTIIDASLIRAAQLARESWLQIRCKCSGTAFGDSN
jgi:hypothetical protein